MSTSELKGWKPCPFCGAKNVKFDKCTLRVRCGACRATSGLITRFIAQGMTEEQAAQAAWNERAHEETD